MERICELEQILRADNLLVESTAGDISIAGLSNDSRKVAPNDLFICKGYGFKSEFLTMAQQKGAICYMSETKLDSPLPAIIVTDVRKAQSLTAKFFYHNPADSFTLIGITGTKGKSTTTRMTYAVMDAISDKPTALISGAGHYVGSDIEVPHLTTPESLDLQHLYSLVRDNGMSIATTEISSQAYQVHRVYGQHFNIGMFLNLGPDHISPHEHPTLEDYLACKIALLENSDTAIICRDTDYFDTVYAAAKAKCQTILLVGETEDCDYRYHDIQKLSSGYAFKVTEKDGSTYEYSTCMDGVFNVKNAVAAIAAGRFMGGKPEAIATALADLAVYGRSDVYKEKDLTVFINYMHNGISCKAVLDGLRYDYGDDAYIIVVMGVAGQRSPTRITGIGENCGKQADWVVFTADDPDTEDPRDLCERLSGAAQGHRAKITIEPDRSKAVELAITQAPAGALIVLGGKGDETTQRVHGVYEPYESDPVAMRRCLAIRYKDSVQ